MGAAARRLRKQLGRRGTFLLIIGVGKVCWGAGFILTPQPTPQGLDLLTDLAPLHCWAWVWVLAGVITASSAFVKVGRDWAGFVAALVPPGLWTIAYTAAVVQGDFARGGFVALWYLTSHIGVILWASTVPEYELPPELCGHESRDGS
ncbi:hypothetical protein IPZ58_07445 [Streptomyces roseoverticillatus]|uniref:hypothetical protein n=1 Tax=Streptomyces roseoverticillatus TaxID=66429 RepID=UPI001F169799|nr:hypothetical protein [Streptomyces roseoverticillatus]MCF3101413.1 hypothetical protein [Streptomyces roseoverticillatus]